MRGEVVHTLDEVAYVRDGDRVLSMVEKTTAMEESVHCSQLWLTLSYW